MRRLRQIVVVRGSPASVPVGAYVVLRLASFGWSPVAYSDTSAYKADAAKPLWSVDFWAGVRPWTTPLLYKLTVDDRARILAQLLISIVCWVVLALAVQRCLSSRWLRAIAFAAILAFSLVPAVDMWDALLLSESLSVSFAALTVAAWLSFLRAPRPRAVAAVLLASLLWVFTRDSDTYVILAIAVLVAVSLLVRADRRLRLYLLVGLVLLFVVASASLGRKNRFNLNEVVPARIEPVPAYSAWFAAHGLPVTRGLANLAGSHAMRVYAEFLASHPTYTLVDPFRGQANRDALFAPDLSRYPRSVRATLPAPLSDLVYPPDVYQLVFWVVVSCAAALAAFRRFGGRGTWLVPLALLVLTIPHALIIWHATPAELGRHALLVGVLARLGELLLIVFALDATVEGVRRPN